jgi:NAD(P)-dependent dehydrogenase (short-subunit alcohol dehydrogenase family)
MSFPNASRRLCLITGGASGIGRATSYRMAADGCDLFLIDRDADGLQVTKEQAQALGARVIIHQIDLADSKNVLAELQPIIDQYEIDLLVNNAGIGFARTTDQTTLEEWDLTFSVNITASFLFCKMVLPQMLQRGQGIIVNVASAGAIVGLKNRVAYCASKSAVLGLTRCIAADHAAQGIRVNAIAPGTVASEWIDRILADVPDSIATRKMMEARQLDGKMGTPQEIAEGIRFLLSAEARFVNGSVFSMDGGLTAV